MTTDIKELVKQLAAGRTLLLRADGDRDLDCQSNITTDTSMALADELRTAIDALEALAGEVESLKQAVEAEKDEQARIEFRLNEVTAERDRLKAALQPFSDAYERLVRTQESMGFGDNAAFGLGIKVSAIKAARKALGGDA